MIKATSTMKRDHFIYSFSKRSPGHAIALYEKHMAKLQIKIDNYILDWGMTKTKEKLRLKKICTARNTSNYFKSLDEFCSCTDFTKMKWKTIQLVHKFAEVI